MKLSCCMIVRDDASTLRACLESIRPHVDELVCIDTGSTDDSPSIAQEYADRWERWTGCNDEQGRIDDFAAARNRSFGLVTGDWVCWIDADDVVVGAENLRKLAETAGPEPTRFVLPYEYAHDAAGRVTLLQYRERLMSPPGKFEWVSPVHEICMPVEPGVDIRNDSVRFIHRQNKSTKAREPDRNLRILKKYISKVGDTDPRALYYYGGELAKHGHFGAAVRAYKRHVELDRWNDQRCRSMLEIGNIYARLGLHEDAEQWFSRAMFVRNWPEPMLALGRLFYQMSRPNEVAATRKLDPEQQYNLRRAAQWLHRGLETEPLRDALLFTDPMETAQAYELVAGCHAALGEADMAGLAAEKGLAIMPESTTLRQNLDWAKQAKARQAQPARMLSVPSDIRVEPQPSDQGKLDLAFFLGPALEQWSPETWAKGGMGGSETMAWELARRLRKRGHRVRMYVECSPAQEGVYEGVEWLQWQRFRNVRCDVLIASRTPWAVRDSFTGWGATVGGCKYTAAILWVHDVHVGQFAQADERRIDRILCLSQWHANYFASGYSGLDREKVRVTRNGIDLSRFDGTEKREPHRAIYSSSPDRGLLAAVLAWPRIREQVPDAELHVFYGFYNWERGCGGDPAQLQAIAHLKQLCATTEGVVMRDRVNQTELAREFMRAGVWAYGTGFHETSCITAMEAQAAGLLMVTSGIGALAETAGANGSFLKEPWPQWPGPPSPAFVDEYARELVHAMLMPEGDMEEFRKRATAYARDEFSLDTLADDWDEMLLMLEAELALEPVPRFRGAAE